MSRREAQEPRAVRCSVVPGDVVEATVRTPAGTVLVRTVADVPLLPSAAAVLPAALPVAMRVGGDLYLDGTIDSVQRVNIDAAQQLLLSWYRHLRPVDVHVTIDDTVPERAAGVGCFFSGGVDSFYAVLRHQERITHLIFVLGFDIAVDDTALGESTLREIRSAASALGKELIVVRTDVRALGARAKLDWGPIYHGAAMAHVAIALAPYVGTVIVPSTHVVDSVVPWGTHRDLDPLWSTARVTFEHDSIEVGRPGKVARIAQSAVAMRHLRVCWINYDGAYNCGRCEKCLRTMLSLRAIGATCETFPDDIDPASVRRLRLTRGQARAMARNVVALEESEGDHAELIEAGRHAIAASRRVWARFFETYDWFVSGACREIWRRNKR